MPPFISECHLFLLAEGPMVILKNLWLPGFLGKVRVILVFTAQGYIGPTACPEKSVLGCVAGPPDVVFVAAQLFIAP